MIDNTDFWTAIALIVGSIWLVGAVLERAVSKGISEIVNAINSKSSSA